MKKITNKIGLSILLMGLSYNTLASSDHIKLLKQVESKVIDWRRDIHQNPELGNREVRTAALVAKHLKSLGMQVETGIAYTGVVGFLKGAKPGPTVMLRADMDALPVTEKTDLPFKSTKMTNYQGVDVGIMHACGHDTHVAMLMGAAEVLSSMQGELAGNVMFVFQPAEEGAPEGEEGGAELMLKQGIFDRYQPDVAFGLHITSKLNVGQIGYRSGPTMASADRFEITVTGEQTHGSTPWAGADPIAAAAQIVSGVNHIVSRQIDITKEPAIVSFGKISGGVRNNIIPEEVNMIGTIRNFDMENRQQIFDKITHTAEHTAKASGNKAKVVIKEGYPVTVNDPLLTEKMLPSLAKVVGESGLINMPKVTGAEDFSFYAMEVPGLFVFLGGTPKDTHPKDAPSNHSPYFFADESAFKLGTRALTEFTLDYLSQSN
ncbi:amidohydrolase [Pseudoalteromonas luteoviolacea]|uniref:N-acyl-L-amino acid amidohydrolase n=1 Tax=Pseudoalteromonas luteoviolacea H33 TaxID=1365251 RepID=A0A167AI60_9GAMM|nr:amidohydrolase [Pseudoalteromonas luteoviolacea]KZN45414.1 N-acyl-L-amino acid amidohydrolase [Pseudoalteromonas luteoviolacea H33]KZN70722.1 N-acyl-L-amino acid amidohydrolase [Pseudoalteromonas luteoviolacea H33-S]MBQ4879141.1 amidohydrolase [Pseudoalteromonas luteoviolacea]MBQ4908104.1 amidohydrolase [Pseudoalteromonas luteoviolacea]